MGADVSIGDGAGTAMADIEPVPGFNSADDSWDRSALAVSCGGTHTCVLREDGSLVCWGENTYGQAAPPVF